MSARKKINKKNGGTCLDWDWPPQKQGTNADGMSIPPKMGGLEGTVKDVVMM